MKEGERERVDAIGFDYQKLVDNGCDNREGVPCNNREGDLFWDWLNAIYLQTMDPSLLPLGRRRVVLAVVVIIV